MQAGVGANRYSYAANDPINKFDPSGNSWWSEAWNELKDSAKDSWNNFIDHFSDDPATRQAARDYNHMKGYDGRTPYEAGVSYSEYMTWDGTGGGVGLKTAGKVMSAAEKRYKSFGRFMSRFDYYAKNFPHLIGKRLKYREFNSFEAFKAYYGRAGNYQDWHHLVEQHTANTARFGSKAIQNTKNLVNIPRNIHHKINAIYNSRSVVPGFRTTREYVRSLSYSEQMTYGRQVVNRVLSESSPVPPALK